MHVREPAVAGLFYPADAEALREGMSRLLAAAQPPAIPSPLVSLILPHAGYQYSGFSAAHGYRLLTSGAWTSVIIVAPSHREYFDGVSVYGGTAYRTPLGDLAIDEDLREAVAGGHDLITVSAKGHGEEHAVEVHLPFIQHTLGKPRILPIVMGDQRREYCYALADRLAEAVGAHPALMIASTDLSHYHPADIAGDLDTIVIDDIARLDADGLMSDLESERAEACGGGPTVAVLRASQALGGDRSYILSRSNSGDVNFDRRRVVGYVAAAIVRSAQT
jgi:AmmeMemoRadiSam system protein B